MLGNRLRHRIRFEEPAKTQNATTGANVTTWQLAYSDQGDSLASVPAEVLTGPGREALQGGGKLAEASARINLRWFPGLLPTWRILWDGRTYDINSIETDATGRQEWRLRCVDGVSDGG